MPFDELSGKDNKNRVSGDLMEGLLKELECPVCMEYMTPPITLCQNGHNICNTCRPKLKKCPNCRQSFISARNIALENLTFRIQYPCCNRKTGCEETFPLDRITEHQKFCPHRFYVCPLSSAPGILCLWQGPRMEIKKHVDKYHKDRITEAIAKLVVYIKGFKETYKYCRVIYALDEIFYQQFNVREDNFYFVVQYVGPEADAVNYKYEFTLSALDGAEKIHVSQVTKSVKIGIDDLFQSGKCVKLHFDIVKNFLEEGNLKFEMKISRVDEE